MINKLIARICGHELLESSATWQGKLVHATFISTWRLVCELHNFNQSQINVCIVIVYNTAIVIPPLTDQAMASPHERSYLTQRHIPHPQTKPSLQPITFFFCFVCIPYSSGQSLSMQNGLHEVQWLPGFAWGCWRTGLASCGACSSWTARCGQSPFRAAQQQFKMK